MTYTNTTERDSHRHLDDAIAWNLDFSLTRTAHGIYTLITRKAPEIVRAQATGEKIGSEESTRIG